MANTWALCALWVGLLLAATLPAIWLKISAAHFKIVAGTVAHCPVVIVKLMRVTVVKCTIMCREG